MKTALGLTFCVLSFAQVGCNGFGFGPIRPSQSVQAASAGGNSGGGGKGILCGNQLRTLDLYEAVEINHDQLLPAPADFDSGLREFAPKLAMHFGAPKPTVGDTELADRMVQTINGIIVSRFKFIPPGSRLPLTQDATLPSLSEGCQEVQIAIYQAAADLNGDVVLVDEEYWHKLSPQDQVALVLHEQIYYYARAFGGDKTSDESRKVIGAIFSGLEDLDLVDQRVLSGPHLQCSPQSDSVMDGSVDDIQFVLADEIENGTSGVSLYFKIIGNDLVLTRTRAFVPNLSMTDIANGTGSVMTSAYNAFNNTTWTVEFLRGTQGEMKIRTWKPTEAPRSFSTIPCVQK